MLLASVYGGYFGAAQGVIYLALMGLLLDDDLQRINAVKNVLAAVVNGIAAVFFLFVADFDWTAVLLIAIGSAVGGQIGARIGRKLAPGGATERRRGRRPRSDRATSCCAERADRAAVLLAHAVAGSDSHVGSASSSSPSASSSAFGGEQLPEPVEAGYT